MAKKVVKVAKGKGRKAKSGQRLASLRQSQSSSARYDSGAHEATLIGLTDPFSAEATVARYPDTGSGRSLTFQQRFNYYPTTDAGGAYCMTINPKVNYPFITGSCSGLTVTWPATADGAGNCSSNLVNTYGLMYRPTSYGIRIICTSSATNASGMLVIAKGGTPVLSGTTTMDPSSFTDWDIHPFSHGGEWHVTGFPVTALAYQMRLCSLYSTNTSVGDPTWQTTYLYFRGLPASTQCITMEVVFNYEYTPLEDAPIAQLAMRQPTADFQMQAAVNHVQSNLPNSHRSGKSAVREIIKKEGKKALVKHVIPFLAKNAVKALA